MEKPNISITINGKKIPKTECFVMMKYTGRSYTVKVAKNMDEMQKLENAGYDVDCGYTTLHEANKEAKSLKQFLG